MALWTGTDFTQAINGDVQGKLPETIDGISIDSRSLQKGDAFFAITGTRVDGHDYVKAAAQAGASILVVAKHKLIKSEYAGIKYVGTALLVVDDVQVALEELANRARTRLKPETQILAITGSVGKTTVKEMLTCLLEPFGKVHASPASFNNHWGVPLSLARMPQETDYAIFEIGMNHAGEITPLTKMVRPKLALITHIAPAHMGNFSSLDDIAAAKAEIFAGLEIDEKLELGGTALLNYDDAYFSHFKSALAKYGHHFIFTFGKHREANYRLMNVTALKAGGQSFIINHNDIREKFHIMAEGEHMAENACAAIAAAAEMAIKPERKKYIADTKDTVQAFKQTTEEYLHPAWEKLKQALDQFQAGAGRGARYKLNIDDTEDKLSQSGSFVLIDESYNANPASMQRALKTLSGTEKGTKGRHIAVLGDMLELGNTSVDAHEALCGTILTAKIDELYLVGQEMRALQAKLAKVGPNLLVHWQEKTQDLATLIETDLRDGDVVMVKGSNSMGLGAIVEDIKKHFFK